MFKRQPDEFENLLHKLMLASDALSFYCTKHGETELALFFERENEHDSLRHYIDEKVAVANPNFMCHKDTVAS
jgi:hypothetical protein